MIEYQAKKNFGESGNQTLDIRSPNEYEDQIFGRWVR